MAVTSLFGIRFGRIRTRWKEIFVHFATEQWFSTCSVLEIEERFVEDEAATGERGIQGGDDDERNDWDNGIGTSRRG